MKRLIYTLITILQITFIFSCAEQSDCDCNNPAVLRPITSEEELIIESANNFAFDIFSRINEADPNKNLFISPLSISTALSMTANGAKGDTKSGIKKTLYQADITDQEINEAYKTLEEFITQLDPKVTMNLANSNWYQQELTVKENFKNTLEKYYDAEVKFADFADPNTKNLINDWIEHKTNGKIKDMISKIEDNAVMFLINAIYLKATWQYQFEKSKTEKMDFYLSDGSKVKTDMMFGEGVKVSLYSNSSMQFIEIPYGNGQFVFTIMLPTEPGKLDEIIREMDILEFNDLLSNADTTTVQLYLPKFKIEYDLTLKSILAQMGMGQSFTSFADLSELFVEDLDYYIDDVLHKSFIEVDEEGTEAAAATVVIVGVLSAGGGGSKPTIFVDHPFAFFIREKHSETILFSGKLIDPTL